MSDENNNVEQLREEIQNLQRKLEESNAAFSSIVGKNRDAILIIDDKGTIIYANLAATNLFGLDLGRLLGEQIGLFIDTNTADLTIINKDRGPLIVEVIISETKWYNKSVKFASLRDVTEKRKLLKLFQHLSSFDYLTNLSNRVHFEEVLKKSIERAKRNNKILALLYLDIDKFKSVNDKYGHHVGDKLLIHVAESLTNCIREGDTVSRIGGDEFTIILEDIMDLTQVKQVAKRILKATHQPFQIDQNQFSVDLSIGIALFPNHGKTPTDLIQNADNAMYFVKSKHVGGYHLYHKR